MLRVHRSFAEVEDLQETASYWDLDFRQMDRGSFAGEIQLAMTSEVQLGHVRLTRCIEQAGAPPPGLRTIAVPASPGLRMFWRGRQVSGQDVLVYPLGSEIDAISQPGFDMYVLSFLPALLLAAGKDLGVKNVDRLLDASDVVRVDPRLLSALRRNLATWFKGWTSAEPTAGLAWARVELPRALLRLFISASSSRVSAPLLRMDKAICMTRALVADRPFEALRVSDLCQSTGVSERTLRHAFRERLGVSPKAYLRDRRLNLVRRELRHADASTTKVVEVANQCGFWHLGQFAADYRRLFNELPSVTLSRPSS